MSKKPDLLGVAQSEMAQRVRDFDWSATPLGPIGSWPLSLLIAVGICLNSRFPMFVWWGPKLINIYNDGYIPMLGARNPRALGRPARESWDDIWADVGPQADLVMHKGQATWNERVHLRMERHGFSEDTWFTWSYSPIHDEGGGVGGLFCAVTEDTPRVLAERQRDKLDGRLRALVTASSDVVYCMSPDWTVMHHLRGQDFIVDTSTESGTWMDQYIPAEERGRVTAAVERAIRDKSAFELEHRVRRVDGSIGWTFSRAVPILNEAGEITEWFGAASDVTTRKEAEETLRKNAADLKEADRRKDEFLAMLAHELRNPLAPISYAVQALRMNTETGPSQKAAQDIIDRQVQQLVRLVDDLLDVSRITRGKVELKLGMVELAAVIDQALETVKPFIEQRGHAVGVDVPHDVWLVADATRLAQVFANILHNAAKYTQPPGMIQVSARRDGDGVRVKVTDNGIGIPADQLRAIFEMFAQVDGSLDRAHGGLGIGLTIAKNLVEMHDGQIRAASEGPGKGTTFEVLLPAQERKGRHAGKPQQAGPKSGKPLRVLVVDDNRDVAQSMGRMLEMLGHSVRVEYGGASAIRASDEFSPDVVLLDIGMPGLNGYDVCQTIKRKPSLKNTVVVAQTGWAEGQRGARAQEAGFDHHLVKPVHIDTLAGLLSSIANRR